MVIKAYFVDSSDKFYKFVCSFASVGRNCNLRIIHNSSLISIKYDYMFFHDDVISLELDSSNFNDLYNFCNEVGILC